MGLFRRSPKRDAPTDARARRSYAESCDELVRLGLLDPGPAPPVPGHRPRHDDDEPLGVTFFRTLVSGDLSSMTLPRTFFGRSEISNASFRNTDLTESTLCWCDFQQVDFTGACLRGCDLRAAKFNRVDFSQCDLEGADVRGSSFIACRLAGANVRGLVIAQDQVAPLGLVGAPGLDVRPDAGEEPGGG